MSGNLADEVITAFRDVTGGEPTGVWSAPGRVNLIGEHTDYNAGLCLPIAIPHRTYAAAGPRDDGQLRVRSLADGLEPAEVVVALDDISAQTPGGWASYPAGVLWALQEQGHNLPGMDIVLSSAVPVGAGLSSSAALTCAVAAAVDGVAGLGLLDSREGRTDLVAAAMRAENEIAGAPTGGLDQAAAMHSSADHALRLDFRSGERALVPVEFDKDALALLVCDTRAPHSLNDGQYAARRKSCEDAAAYLGISSLREVRLDDLPGVEGTLGGVDARRVRHVVTEIARVDAAVHALTVGDFAEVGRLFLASHVSLRDDYEVSCPELDTVVATAMSAGALGARMTGGGFGGSAIALIPADLVQDAITLIESTFADKGWAQPHCFTVTPSGPAARDR
ncbi:MAG: galactokinase [Actinomycetia bacterium]|nr:galactokinase [Actinomycetes bacterium]